MWLVGVVFWVLKTGEVCNYWLVVHGLSYISYLGEGEGEKILQKCSKTDTKGTELGS